uniref:Uncharacterized protein n=1 Tax=Arundo donax TaxID=35708 RepID=A0A0A9EY38_ARUDO
MTKTTPGSGSPARRWPPASAPASTRSPHAAAGPAHRRWPRRCPWTPTPPTPTSSRRRRPRWCTAWRRRPGARTRTRTRGRGTTRSSSCAGFRPSPTTPTSRGTAPPAAAPRTCSASARPPRTAPRRPRRTKTTTRTTSSGGKE